MPGMHIFSRPIVSYRQIHGFTRAASAAESSYDMGFALRANLLTIHIMLSYIVLGAFSFLFCDVSILEVPTRERLIHVHSHEWRPLCTEGGYPLLFVGRLFPSTAHLNCTALCRPALPLHADRCAMALVHSRIRRVIYGVRDPGQGCLGSLMMLHTLPALNHNYRVFEGVCSQECRQSLLDEPQEEDKVQEADCHPPRETKE